MKPTLILIAALAALNAGNAHASDDAAHAVEGDMILPGLMLPQMDAARGRALFAEKGCVVCHSVNGVGGEDAPMLDAEFMDEAMNPFEFAARMWRGAAAMVAMQEEELGAQIELSGQELADIIAFVHNAEEQKRFGEADIPEHIEEMMHHDGLDGHGDEDADGDHGD